MSAPFAKYLTSWIRCTSATGNYDSRLVIVALISYLQKELEIQAVNSPWDIKVKKVSYILCSLQVCAILKSSPETKMAFLCSKFFAAVQKS